MSYKNNTLRELQEFTKEFPTYTLSEILYSAIRLIGVKDIKDLMKVSDEQLYTAINSAIDLEKEEEFQTEDDLVTNVNKLYGRV